jgi:hypothetical protein
MRLLYFLNFVLKKGIKIEEFYTKKMNFIIRIDNLHLIYNPTLFICFFKNVNFTLKKRKHKIVIKKQLINGNVV